MTSYCIDPKSLPFPISLLIRWNDYYTSTIPTKIPFVRVQRPPIDMSQLPEGADYIGILINRAPYISKKEKAILRQFIAY